MESQSTILLYSKYSQYSNKLIKLIEESNTDFVKNVNLTNLCVDNEDVRKRILKSKNIIIQNVPCILILYNDGGVEKYEGDDAFKWVEEIISKLNPTPRLLQQPVPSHLQPPVPSHLQPPVPPHLQQPVPPHLQQPVPPHLQQPVQPHLQQPVPPHLQQPVPPHLQQPVPPHLQPPVPPHLQQPVPPHLQQPVPPHLQQPVPNHLQQPVPPHINNIENRKKPNKKESTKSKITDLVELESLEDEEEEVTILEDIETEDHDQEYNNIEMNDLFPPKQASLRSGPGSYDLNNSFGDKKNDTKIKKGIKTSTESVVKKGKMSVMEAAMAMQKTREKEVESEPKQVFA
jgi:hypothetical protein